MAMDEKWRDGRLLEGEGDMWQGATPGGSRLTRTRIGGAVGMYTWHGGRGGRFARGRGQGDIYSWLGARVAHGMVWEQDGTWLGCPHFVCHASCRSSLQLSDCFAHQLSSPPTCSPPPPPLEMSARCQCSSLRSKAV